jgi:hypothetical protein
VLVFELVSGVLLLVFGALVLVLGILVETAGDGLTVLTFLVPRFISVAYDV